MKKAINIFMMAFVLVCFAACGQSSAAWKKLDETAAAAKYKELSSGGDLDLSKVYTLRLTIDGVRRDVVSLQPDLLAAENVGDTIMAWSKDRTRVEILTRNVKAKEYSYRELKVEDMKPKFAFTFPMIKDTTIVEAKVEVVDLRTVP